jgi:hypothetical protein
MAASGFEPRVEPSPAPPVASALFAPVVTKTVFLALRARPARTQLFLDGEPLPHNPFFGTYLADGLVHSIEADAPGYLREARLLRFDGDQALELTLASASPKPATALRPLSRAPSTDTADPDDSRKPIRRSLDPTNPWIP